MIPYYSLLVLGILLLLTTPPRQTHIAFIYIFVGILILFSGLRYDVGQDYQSYSAIIAQVAKGGDVGVEIGFQVLVSVLTAFSLDEKAVFVVAAALAIIGFVYFLKNKTSRLGLSVFLFAFVPVFFLSSFNTVRQAVAVSFFLVAIVQHEKKRYVSTVLFAILAICFHKTVLFFLPLLLLYRLPFKTWHYVTIMLFYLLIVKFLPSYLTFFGFSSIYTTDLFSPQNGLRRSYLSYVLVVFFFLYLFFARNRWQKFVFSRQTEFMLFVYCLITLSTLVVPIRNDLILRLDYYVTPFFIVAANELVLQTKAVRLRNVVTIAIVGAAVFYFVLTVFLNGSKYHIVPYSVSVFQS